MFLPLSNSDAPYITIPHLLWLRCLRNYLKIIINNYRLVYKITQVLNFSRVSQCRYCTIS